MYHNTAVVTVHDSFRHFIKHSLREAECLNFWYDFSVQRTKLVFQCLTDGPDSSQIAVFKGTLLEFLYFLPAALLARQKKKRFWYCRDMLLLDFLSLWTATVTLEIASDAHAAGSVTYHSVIDSKLEGRVQKLNTWTLSRFLLISLERSCLQGALFGWWRFSPLLFPACSPHARNLTGLSLQSAASTHCPHWIPGRLLCFEV